jgi:hypothetical protein
MSKEQLGIGNQMRNKTGPTGVYDLALTWDPIIESAGRPAGD